MPIEIMYLDGLVLRSLDIDRTRDFYQALLKVDFKLEQHDGGQPHYAGRDAQRLLFEVYPSKRAVTPPSPDLTFKVLRKNIIQERIQDYLEGYRFKNLKQTGEKQWEFADPDTRKITIFQDDKADDYITLDSIGLHCYSLDATKEFYEHLLNVKAKEKKSSEGKTHYKIPLPKVKLEFHSVPQTVVPASPTLLFHVSNLDYIAQRMKGRIKEIKQLPHIKEATLSDSEGRKIYLYENLPEPSWLEKKLDQLCQYFQR